jgi:putative heme iron utilization protein
MAMHTQNLEADSHASLLVTQSDAPDPLGAARIHELASEHFTQNVHRQEEFLLRVDPLRVVGSQPAGWNHTMNVRMVASTPTIP